MDGRRIDQSCDFNTARLHSANSGWLSAFSHVDVALTSFVEQLVMRQVVRVKIGE
jgi:hypothetical protein